MSSQKAERQLLEALSEWSSGGTERDFCSALNSALLTLRRSMVFDILCGNALPPSVYDKVFAQLEHEMIFVKKIINSSRDRKTTMEYNHKYRVLCARRASLVEANDYQ